MVFSSPFFVSVFLPALLLIYFLAPGRLRNPILLVFSLFFYTWGEPKALPLMLLVIILNYFAAKIMACARSPRLWLTAAISANLLLLIIFKYLDFLLANINIFLESANFAQITLPHIALPIGISFYIFQAISYIVDVYRRNVPPQQNIFRFALYISLFPQLIAGPIVRYISIYKDFPNRRLVAANIQDGLIRFCVGLAKKVFIADNMGFVADAIFASPTDEIPCLWAWLGALVYALQIYYDFSAYSDMAIGIGRIFNFQFPENFNYPYSARTLQDFWRRWHISLTAWLKDYLYIPLGGSKGSLARTRRNILIVLLCCGIWHGAAWNFLVWGLYNGLGLIAERIIFKKTVARASLAPIDLLHTLLVLLFILVGWVIFRCESFAQIMGYLRIMFAGNPAYSIYSLDVIWTDCVTFSNMLFLASALVFCVPVSNLSYAAIDRSIVKKALILILFGITYAFVITSSYSPFLYFRF